MAPFIFSRTSASAPAEPTPSKKDDDWLATPEEENDFDGQLAVDAYETDTELVIKAPVAGVRADDLDIQITDNYVTIRGQREDSHQLDAENFYLQECYWGSFARTFELPFTIDSKKASAALKDGLLTIRLPKDEKVQAKKLKVEIEQ